MRQTLYFLFYFFCTWLTISYIQYKERPFRHNSTLIEIKTVNNLPNSFFTDLQALNFGLAHRLFSLFQSGKGKAMRIGNAVLLIDQVHKQAFLTGRDIDDATLTKISEYCQQEQLDLFCNPKYNAGLTKIFRDLADCKFTKKLVFECHKEYKLEPHFGLSSSLVMEPKIVPMNRADFRQTAQAQYMCYMYGSNDYRSEMEGYVLKIGDQVVGEIFLVMGTKNDWLNMSMRGFLYRPLLSIPFVRTLIQDNRRAEIYIYIKNPNLRKKGYGAAISKYVINQFRSTHPNCKLYWVCHEYNRGSVRLAKKLGLKPVGALNQIIYREGSIDLDKMHALMGQML